MKNLQFRKPILILAIAVIILIGLVTAWLSARGKSTFSFPNSTLSTSSYNDLLSECTKKTSYDFLHNTNSEIIFDDEALIVDGNTCYYSLLTDSKSAYSPLITLKYSSNSHSPNIAFSGAITDKIISSNTPIPFIIYDDNSYFEYNLVCTTLPVMNITYEGGSLSDIDTPMSIYMYDNRLEATTHTFVADGLIHIRGNTTKNYPKKAFRLTIDNADLLGLRSDDDWMLYAIYNDPERIRNVFNQNLWKYTCSSDNAYNIETGSEYRYIELFINGEYHGLYALGYPIDNKLLGFSNDITKNVLYKVHDYSNAQRLDIAEDGSVISYEAKVTSGNFESASRALDTYSPYNLLFEYFRYLDDNSNDTVKLMSGIDIDNAIDIYLFLNMIQGMDNTWKSRINNQYLAIFSQDDNLVGLHCPWDMDITWGNEWDEIPELNYTIPYNIPSYFNEPMEYGYLSQIVYNNDSDIWEKIINKYNYLRQDKWSENNLYYYIDMYEAQIFDSGAYDRDVNRWPDSTHMDNPGAKLNTFKDYVHERLIESDEYINRMSDFGGESVFIRRSAQYKYFLESDFIIEINDPSLLSDPDYIELFKYMNINIASITDETNHIYGSPSGEFSYVHSEETISPIPDEDTNAPSGIRILFCYDGRWNHLDSTRGYELRE